MLETVAAGGEARRKTMPFEEKNMERQQIETTKKRIKVKDLQPFQQELNAYEDSGGSAMLNLIGLSFVTQMVCMFWTLLVSQRCEPPVF
jgi:hypothetical protein